MRLGFVGAGMRAVARAALQRTPAQAIRVVASACTSAYARMGSLQGRTVSSLPRRHAASASAQGDDLAGAFNRLNISPTVVRLTPPAISEATLSERILCKRPRRDGRFNISCSTIQTKRGEKIRVDCNGHGGSGITTSFGSVRKAIELYTEKNPDKKTPIRVIGSGIIGLMMAIELVRLGYRVAGISTKSLHDIASYKAAGYFALVSVKTDQTEQANLNAIGEHTFRTFQEVEKGAHPYLTKECVRYMPVYCSDDTETGLEDVEAKGLIPKREYVTLDFKNGVQHPHYVKLMTYFMNTTTIMKQLLTEVRRLGIPITMEEVSSFDAVVEPVVFNCAGLGARALNSDDKITAVWGHLITLNQQAGSEHMDYMVYTKVKQDGRDEYIYLFPKDVSITRENGPETACRAVLGGTFIENAEGLSKDAQDQLNQIEFRRMLDRNSRFFHGKPFTQSRALPAKL